MRKPFVIFFGIILLTIVASLIALPSTWPIHISAFGRHFQTTIGSPVINMTLFGRPLNYEFKLKQGLDIQGGMQVILQAEMGSIPLEDRKTALESAREVIARRVDLYGIAEPSVQTSQYGDQHRLIVELPGVEDPAQALQLVGTTAELDFRLESTDSAQVATPSVATFLDMYQPTGLTGKQLKRATVQFDQQTGEPVVSLEFNPDGSVLFSDITTQNVGGRLGIFIDSFPIMVPTINTPITDGRAIITGGFALEDAKQLAIQLNAGALPVPITVLEQRTIGASLGQDSVQKSVRAGLIGLGLVMIFMILIYGVKGLLADLALIIYAVLTIAVYKLIGVTLTLPGIAGLLLSIGMAVDSNILIFERMKEELRLGKPFKQAMELGFGRAWDSIKDANIATIMTALILINPLNLPFLSTSGLVRGFGLTLLIGVSISLFTGIVVTRTFMRLFLGEKHA
jgi:preprotein translocase subunit SecD